MKKLTLALVVLLALAFAGVSYGAENLGFPGKNHSGDIGKSSRVWQGIWTDYGYFYGGQSYYGKIAATPTANRIWTMPNQTGKVPVRCTTTHSYAGASADWTLTAAETECGFIVVTNGATPSAALNAIIATANVVPGQTWMVWNNTGYALAFKVAGATGATQAAAKHAYYGVGATDTMQIWPQP